MCLFDRSARALCAALFLLLLTVPRAEAISMDKASTIRDQCEISIGPDLIGIVAYMPDRSRDRFCAEFPSTGRIILTIDLVAQRLRDLPIDVRVVREPKGPLSEDDDLAAHTVAFVAPRLYPGGAVIVEHAFAESGNYAAFITAIETSGARRTTRFGFTVGGALQFYTPAILAAVLLTGLVYVYWLHGRKRAHGASSGRRGVSRFGGAAISQ